MKIYFDEAGNTGCVLTKGSFLNFKEQPFFVLGSVIVDDEIDANNLIAKYECFKKLYNISGEIKGTDLMTKKYNRELEYILNNVFDNKHYRINVYDKRFYLSTLLLSALLGQEFLYDNKVIFYQLASSLSLQDDIFFIQYCNYIMNPTKENFHNYLLFLSSFKYQYISSEDNAVKIFVDQILKDNSEEVFYDDFMTSDWYQDKSQVNVINLTALGELISFIKDNKTQKNILYIHDKIDQFENTLNNELKDCNINLQFKDSKDNELLQLCDNVTSIANHAFKKMREHFQNKEEWLDTSLWDMKVFSKLLSILNPNNIKYTVPIQDWAVSLCAYKMFSDDFPKIYRNNLYFNLHYKTAQKEILNSLHNNKQKLSDVLNRLKK